MRRDFERLLAVIRLRHQQIVHIHAQFSGVGRIQGVLHIDERGDAAGLLRLGDHLQRDGCFTGRLRSENLIDTAPRETAHAQRSVQRNRTRRDHRDRYNGVLRPQTQDRALAKLFLNLAEGEV